MVNRLIKLASESQVCQERREMVNWQIEVAHDGEEEEGGGQLVNRLMK